MRLLIALLVACLPLLTHAQSANKGGLEIGYYLPDLEYDPSIPTPEEFLGWQIGEWHISHDLQQAYLRALAAASDRVVLEEYARSYEQRPLVTLIYTTPKNHKNLEELRQKHLSISKLGTAGSDNLKGVPGVLYQGFSIHGNEPSGGNAAPLVAYYLAAAPMSVVGELLENNIILLDPCYNPDGFNRFASWANTHKASRLNPDPQDREYSEAWPRGRSNHYWFDLNRDWLPAQHPESRGRVATFQKWRPNVLTDHHEMGTNSTFFFMPGEPTRVFPGTPAINQELTKEIGTFHSAALDEIGSLYYSGEGYDDFYLGKGSTYPDMQGTVGILFEQGSSRGHIQESENGLITFPFTIRNQVVTALSTQKAFVNLREKLLTYQRDFYRKSKTENGGYVIDGDGDPGRLKALAELLGRHDIAVKQYGDHTPTGLYVPLGQTQHQLVTALFEPISKFDDSLFYDVSTWTLSYAFNLPTRKTANPPGDFMPVGGMGELPIIDDRSEYAYFLPWNDYYAPKAAYALMDHGLRVKVSHLPFTGKDGVEYGRGTLMIPVVNQGNMSTDEVYEIIRKVEEETRIEIVAAPGGTVNTGLMLGSRSAYNTLEKPEVLLLVEGGVNSLDAGEVWHLLDQRFDMPVTKMPLSDVARADLDRYNVIVMPDGNYGDLGSGGVEAIKKWMDSGKTLITSKRSATWAAANGLAKLTTRPNTSGDTSGDPRANRRPYTMADRDGGGQVLGGSIFQTTGDLTHPLLYGFQREEVPVFRRGTLMFEPSVNDYATPLLYTATPFMSGYVPRGFSEKLAGSAAIVVSGASGGRTICFADNPNFRAFWYGTNRLFMNAIFFGSAIDGSTVE